MGEVYEVYQRILSSTDSRLGQVMAASDAARSDEPDLFERLANTDEMFFSAAVVYDNRSSTARPTVALSSAGMPGEVEPTDGVYLTLNDDRFPAGLERSEADLVLIQADDVPAGCERATRLLMLAYHFGSVVRSLVDERNTPLDAVVMDPAVRRLAVELHMAAVGFGLSYRTADLSGVAAPPGARRIDADRWRPRAVRRPAPRSAPESELG